MSKQQRLNNLFAEWRNQVEHRGHFIEDGFIDETLWDQAKRKILFLLKEPNSDEGNWTYRQFVLDEGYLKETATWPNLIRWAYGILHDFPPYREVEYKFTQIRLQAKDFLKCAAFANIKKICGGPSADREELMDFVQKNYSFLLEQIEILEPDTVLCCGDVVFQAVVSALTKAGDTFDTGSSDGGLEYLHWPRLNTHFVRYHHPGAYFPKHMSYTFLMGELQKLPATR